MSPERAAETSESPTYKHDQWGTLDHFVCLLCGHEDWSEPTLLQHMQVYHQARMVEAPPGYEPPTSEEMPTAEDFEEEEVPTSETADDEGVNDG